MSHDWIPAFAGMTDCTIAVDLDYSRKHRHPGESRDPSLVAAGAIVSVRPMDVLERPIIHESIVIPAKAGIHLWLRRERSLVFGRWIS